MLIFFDVFTENKYHPLLASLLSPLVCWLWISSSVGQKVGHLKLE